MTSADITAASPYEGLASHYSETRPSYPDAAIAELKGTSGIVADVGAGTGIFTRQLAGLLPDADVIGIEPSADMRGMAQFASGHLGNISFLAGTAETLPFADAGVALISVATAVHWFDRPAFYREAFRCLGDGGRLVIVQNIRRWWDSEWLAAYEALHESTVAGYRRGTFPAFDGHYRALDIAVELEEHALVSSVATRDVEWQAALSKKDFVSFSLSSTVTQRAVAAIGETAYLDRLERLLQAHSRDGLVVIDYVTRVVTAMRADRPNA